jgi:glycine cleavage system H lipoate-binding protein
MVCSCHDHLTRVGWICKLAISDPEKELDLLLDEEGYKQFLESQGGDAEH